MAGSGFWAGLKRLFTGAPKQPDHELTGAPKQPDHERFCMSCHKITGGSLNPKPASQGAAMDFTCADCGSQTQVLQ